jgi:DNA-binding CsgD family transcriptional regulator
MKDSLEEQLKGLLQEFIERNHKLQQQALLLESVITRNNLYFVAFDSTECILYHNLPNPKQFNCLADIEYILQKDIVDKIREYMAVAPSNALKFIMKNSELGFILFTSDKCEGLFFLQITLSDHQRAMQPIRDEREYFQAENGFDEIRSALKLLEEIKNMESADQTKRLFREIRDHYLPALKQLQQSVNDPIISVCFEIIRNNFEEVIDQSGNISTLYRILTPSEIKVAEFIRMGKSSQDIAEALDIAKKTVENHRNSLRDKLGLKNKGVNLRSYLLNLDRSVL